MIQEGYQTQLRYTGSVGGAQVRGVRDTVEVVAEAAEVADLHLEEEKAQDQEQRRRGGHAKYK